MGEATEPVYRCAECGRKVKVRSPKRGDGSMLVPYPHKTGLNAWCRGRHMEAVLELPNG